MRPPNVLLLVTDQQRRPRHWPEDPEWLARLMPNEAELARTGLSFDSAFCNASMCSPSRATLFTGTYPARHGVTLTLTAADLKPDPRNLPASVAELAGALTRSRRTAAAGGGRCSPPASSASARRAAASPSCDRRPRTWARCWAPPATRSATRESGT